MDMTYNFLQDEEPTEEQLETLMCEVAEEASERRKIADANFRKLIRIEIELASQRYKSFIKTRK